MTHCIIIISFTLYWSVVIVTDAFPLSETETVFFCWEKEKSRYFPTLADSPPLVGTCTYYPLPHVQTHDGMAWGAVSPPTGVWMWMRFAPNNAHVLPSNLYQTHPTHTHLAGDRFLFLLVGEYERERLLITIQLYYWHAHTHTHTPRWRAGILSSSTGRWTWARSTLNKRNQNPITHRQTYR